MNGLVMRNLGSMHKIRSLNLIIADIPPKKKKFPYNIIVDMEIRILPILCKQIRKGKISSQFLKEKQNSSPSNFKK